VSHLEKWIAEFRAQEPRPGSSLKVHPALPWLQLTRWGFAGGGSRVSLQSSYRHVRFDLENVRLSSDELASLENFPDHLGKGPLSRALQLLQAYKPTALSVSWQVQGKTGAWVSRAGSRQSFPAPQRRTDSLMIHISWKPQSVSAWKGMERRNRAILDEYVKRTHFAPRPILLQGRPSSSDLELSHILSRPHNLMAVLAAPQQEALAAAPPIIYNPHQVFLNGQVIHSSEGVSQGLSGPARVSHYFLNAVQAFSTVNYDCSKLSLSRKNLDHNELLIAYDAHKGPEHFERVALQGTQAFLLPVRRVGPSWMVRYSVRPFRVARLYCVPQEARPGSGWLLPVHHGVSLDPVPLEGVPDKSLWVCVCPAGLEPDDAGLRLPEGPALQAWIQELREQARQLL